MKGPIVTTGQQGRAKAVRAVRPGTSPLLRAEKCVLHIVFK